ncbi:hypothetical protein B0H17DRAFT_1190485 [Mycena rosella]|uniref:Uncharacterized protein n=1 Tax=Mycena rosella TaxID=1033263 RepID=A0AAD7MCL2_MYCRO|nr:hypothetical protein B0H17DRAFT_1190485 [Mycena rosella]
MSSPLRCAVLFYPDPAQPEGPQAAQNIYLVTGQNIRCPGAYISWPSANAQYSTVSRATLKSYKQWAPLEVAWFASCDRGEHTHPADPDILVATVRLDWGQSTLAQISVIAPRIPASALCVANVICPQAPASSHEAHHPCCPRSRCNLSACACSSPAHAPPPAHDTLPVHPSSPSMRIVGKMAYAIKHGGRGVVFDDYGGARELYHRLQINGGSPSLAMSLSLTRGVSYLEGFLLGEASAARQSWIGKERKARGVRVLKCWETATDSWRGTQDGVWISDSESEASEVSSLSRSTGAGESS